MVEVVNGAPVKAPKPKKCKQLPATATKAELREAHRAKMKTKAARRAAMHQQANERARVLRVLEGHYVDTYGLKRRRHKYLPHQSDREIGRRQAREL